MMFSVMCLIVWPLRIPPICTCSRTVDSLSLYLALPRHAYCVVLPFIYNLLPEIMGRLLFDFIGGQAHVVSVLNSLTGPGTKDKSFNLVALQCSRLENGNVLNGLRAQNF